MRGTGFWLLWGNAVSIALVMSADRFTFEWLVGETLDASDLATGLVFFALGTPVFLFVLAAGAMADRHEIGQHLAAGGERAGFVERERVDAARHFEIVAALEQDAVARGVGEGRQGGGRR